MSLSKQIGPEFRAFEFTHDRRRYEVFRVVRGQRFSRCTRSPACIRAWCRFAISAGLSSR
jgi:hypothetical protein